MPPKAAAPKKPRTVYVRMSEETHAKLLRLKLHAITHGQPSATLQSTVVDLIVQAPEGRKR